MQGNVSFALLLSLLAGLSTGIGSVLALLIPRRESRHLPVLLGFSAGVMIYISFAELLHTAIDMVGFGIANLWFFIGIAFIMVVDVLVPHEYKEEQLQESHHSFVSRNESRQESKIKSPGFIQSGDSSRLMRSGVLIALGIAIHNFPEGLVVFSSTVSGNRTLGLVVATAIAVHNIPEGISVAVPIFEATGNRWRAFLYSFSSGLAEPIGAIIGYAILFPFLTTTLVYALLAFSGGIMVYISLDEILPTAYLHNVGHLVIGGILAGMLVMAISLLLIH